MEGNMRSMPCTGTSIGKKGPLNVGGMFGGGSDGGSDAASR
jgi:hypothetical protein